MSFSGQRIFCAAAIFNLLLVVPCFAQNTTNLSALLPMPSVPMLKSPVEIFRNLLAMTPAERRESLSNRPPEIQKKLLAKVREYESLRPDERELRLRATELQWYLQPLMSTAPTNRAAWLERIPDDMRRLVEDRLARWDLLPPPMQEELLNDEMTSRYFTQLESATDEQRKKILAEISPERRAKLKAGLDRWRALSPEERDKTLASFNTFFELTPREKQKALNTLSAAERRQMEKTLQAYTTLTPQQRAQCIRSFEKFARMTLPERQEFLKNAERWKLMTPAERDSWRKLVQFAPMLPPEPPVRLPMLPPMPRPPLHRASATVATNQN